MDESSRPVDDLSAITESLRESLADGSLSRNERQTLTTRFADLDADARKTLLRVVFELARQAAADEASQKRLAWVEAQVKLLTKDETNAPESEALFSPTDPCYRRIAQLFERSQKCVDVCVFTITDDRISEQMLLAHGRGVAIRIITDNEKAEDLGSDIDRLSGAGIPVVVDRTSFHMHHKFAIFDQKLLLTGSYNWTRGAAESNEENFIITADSGLLTSFSRTFDRLWQRLSGD